MVRRQRSGSREAITRYCWSGWGWVMVRQGSGGMATSVLGMGRLGGSTKGTHQPLVAGLQGHPVQDPQQHRLLAQQLGPFGG